MFDIRAKVNGRPLLVGHRGAMAVAPENTMPAFEAGYASGADILELDVQLSADGHVMVFHDNDLLAKTGNAGRVHDLPAEFLQTLDVGSYFDPAFANTSMPRLIDVLTWAKGRIPLMIELKQGAGHFDRDLDQKTVELVESAGMEDEVIITCFDQASLLHVHQLNPTISTSFIYIGRVLNPVKLVEGCHVQALSPATDFLTPEDVATIQQAGYACSPGGFWWDYPTLLSWGVDSISSNDPAAVYRWIAS